MAIAQGVWVSLVASYAQVVRTIPDCKTLQVPGVLQGYDYVMNHHVRRLDVDVYGQRGIIADFRCPVVVRDLRSDHSDRCILLQDNYQVPSTILDLGFSVESLWYETCKGTDLSSIVKVLWAVSFLS